MRQAKLVRALALADQLIRATGDLDEPTAHALARRIRMILHPTMDIREILALVPGDTVTDRAKAIGISRQALYRWMESGTRPNNETARRLAALTGISEDVIRAR